MCAPSVVDRLLAGLSRREFLRLGTAAAAAALAPDTAAGGDTAAAPHVPPPPGDARRSVVTLPSPRTVRVAHMADLTHALDDRFPVVPVPGGLSFAFKQTVLATLERNGVFVNRWEMFDHTGTHIDAPAHFVRGGYTGEAHPIASLVVPLVVIDVRPKARRDHDAALTVDDVRAWERRHGRVPRDAAVFMNAGWWRKASDPKAYLGLDASGTLHSPGFAPEACEFLAHERGVSGLGTDTITIDVGADTTYDAHKVLFRAGRWAIENVAHLDQVPPAGATVFIGAAKVAGASGAPARLLATWA